MKLVAARRTDTLGAQWAAGYSCARGTVRSSASGIRVQGSNFQTHTSPASESNPKPEAGMQ
jgi:hypothetical protein